VTQAKSPMHKAMLALAVCAIGTVFAGTVGGCNNVGSCPAKETIMPGGPCSGDSLECAYDLATENPACDGTNTTIPTSCTCTKGAWVCPPPASCEGGDDGGGGDSTTGSDGPSGDASSG
jgi:hypothetical protein